MTTFIFGNSDDLTVDASSTSNNAYFLGSGKMDAVTANGTSLDTIHLGKGPNDSVTADAAENDTITLGSGANDSVFFGHADGDTIRLGNGAGDTVFVSFEASSSKISLGNGANDSVSADELSGGNTITVGNGTGDSVDLFNRNPESEGGDTIVTGTGLDTVSVGRHASADTFGFALGTNGTAFTAVGGAQVDDQVAVGKQSGIVTGSDLGLGNTLVNEGSNSSWTSLAAFIQAIATPLTPGDTYMGNNGTDTFIFTDTANGRTGAIEIAGVFSGTNSTISNHMLTLQT